MLQSVTAHLRCYGRHVDKFILNSKAKPGTIHAVNVTFTLMLRFCF